MKLFYSKIKSLFDAGQKRSFVILVIMMVIGAGLEMIGLTLLVPIIDIVSDPEKLNQSDVYQSIYTFIGASSVNDFIVRFSLIVIGYILIKNTYLTFLNLRQANFIKRNEMLVTNRLLRAYLLQPYICVSHKNSADMIRNINQEVGFLFAMMINAILIVLAEIFVVVALVGLMIYVSPGATFMAFGILSFAGVVFIFGIRKFLKTLGVQRQQARGKMIEWATQSLQSLKELLVAKKENYFLSNFQKQSKITQKAEIFELALNRVPQLFIETFAIITLLTVMIYTYMQGTDFIAVLSVFALVLLRLMPTMNRVIICLSRIRFYSTSLDVVINELENVKDIDQTKIQTSHTVFNQNLSIENIVFQYPESNKNVLNGVNMTIQKGSITSIVGPSGSGKSTLMDIVLRLLDPKEGVIRLDDQDITNTDKDFRDLVSYLPQSVVLLNASIAENIAFGVDENEIDYNKINNILTQVDLENMVEAMPHGLATQIGDINAKVSGGQRQRIGIARALYHDKDILFLDEATAGLDPETENRICKTLKSLTPEKTIISISHQPALINIADEAYEMRDGRLVPTKMK
jgi:ABC-type multidrug transport system fused ATPase/permease subunit